MDALLGVIVAVKSIVLLLPVFKLAVVGTKDNPVTFITASEV